MPFERRTLTGPFVASPGIDADLQLNTPSSGVTSVTFHSSGLTYVYQDNGIGIIRNL